MFFLENETEPEVPVQNLRAHKVMPSSLGAMRNLPKHSAKSNVTLHYIHEL